MVRSPINSIDLQCVGVARRRHRSFASFHTKRSPIKNYQYILLKTLIDLPYPRLLHVCDRFWLSDGNRQERSHGLITILQIGLELYPKTAARNLSLVHTVTVSFKHCSNYIRISLCRCDRLFP
ncbi:MAG: hypothetical protein RM049_27005 [Nostoc sp. DedQUE04]|uniref:hypothetical protein n=1 Tax=Nostoc sp. DedQUE04 TaxID=3075390 RepID=UPI002AD239CC|nr:hypothetical protein [Nostoc sp. DedQUE04]MDZ8138910.1 hypothetical protein [Nostoc sp. DedQUE04]